MKSIIFIVLALAATVPALGQLGRPAPLPLPTPPAGKRPAPTNESPFKSSEISIDNWSSLAIALDKENWQVASELAWNHIQTMKSDNDKKQLAQLRYIYLYAMAGRVLSLAPNQNDEAERLWNEIDLAMETFINKEIVMPPRPFAVSCAKKLNFVCRSQNDALTFRTTATNREGNAIHSFDYVKFDVKPDLSMFDGKDVFMGGILKKADYNDNDRTKPWALRLYLNKGYLRVVVK